jgi:S-adenosylmethionine:tRNA ribosyltransferase-isomerase
MTVTELPAGVRFGFDLPADRVAAEPPEGRGLARDEVRLLVATDGGLTHARFHELGRFLRPGDLVVVNTSATVPAAVDGRRETGAPVVVHFSTPRDDGTWVVELRRPDGTGPARDGRAGERIRLPGAAHLTLVAPHPAGPAGSTGSRLWRATYTAPPRATRPAGRVDELLAAHGRPITYAYLRGRWPLAAYQPVFGREPGSAEMASAGRPFTDRLVTDLVTRGIAVAPILLHAGVSSLDTDEPPQPERFRVPATTAGLVSYVRHSGGRVVAVGTTVARALETVARPDGTVTAGQGWTDLVLGPDRPARVVGGLVTGWHPPEASHLLLLEAVAGPELVERAYREALRGGYRWHEFGDSCLLLPTVIK